ncbi:hypothetical protein E3P89_00448 [Wallemia ichthyophaga]|uniref:Uncharacterized protein n=1 Tax=Wallemia ichthyophaga TaxID=245174 RepID=A0A4T0HP31_WALIC|nr:hypothetical protein E3P90_00607 [Wallemia ichthyophaga]TIB17792.1 hypothetical protein E3P93_00464 [Wallemia ichthyophaga]TIB25545.1 hypothetical protein E3P89_00448 [Wallemia ichthyophaga]TIB27000.1 hypothetical protein E3P88_00476 [Wallemia ichthyophaga]
MEDIQQQSFTFADDTQHALSLNDLARREEEEDVDLNVDNPEHDDEPQHPAHPAQRVQALQAELKALRKFREPLQKSVDALCIAQTHNHRLAERVEQTSTLLDEYTRILGQQEHTRNLMLNEHWKGATDDMRVQEHRQRENQRIQREAEAQESRRRQAEEAETERNRVESEKDAQLRAAMGANEGVLEGALEGPEARLRLLHIPPRRRPNRARNRAFRHLDREYLPHAALAVRATPLAPAEAAQHADNNMYSNICISIYPFFLLITAMRGLILAGIAALLGLSQPSQAKAFNDPAENGGRWLTRANSDDEVGEPLNIVISGDSDPLVMQVDDSTPGGFYTYWDSLHFQQEFAGIHLGGDQLANVGDGLVAQQGILRYNYNDRNGGTLYESRNGGNHIRYWNQSSTNALFIAASAEMDKEANHMIIPNGYNLGRDWIAGNATAKAINNATADLTQKGQTVGYWTRNGDAATNVSFTYETELSFKSNLTTYNSSMVNHNEQVSVNGNPPQDGLVALLKVSIKSGNNQVNADSWAVAHGVSYVFATLSVILSAIYLQVITCKAAVAWEANTPLVVEEIQVSPPLRDEVRVRVEHTGVCHTDAFAMTGKDLLSNFPCILGHEGGAVVESVGEGVDDIAPGDHVIPLYISECTSCTFCISGKTNLCQRLVATQYKGLMSDGSTRFSCRGTPVNHFMGTSTFAQYSVLSRHSVAVVDKKAPLQKACLLGCGITTGYGAATKQKVQGETVAVLGAGCVGLAAVQGAKAAGARRIIAVDTNSNKEQHALKHGATDFVNPLHIDRTIESHLIDITGGGLDHTIVCIGNVGVMRSALEACHKGWGQSVIIGLAPMSDEISTNPLQLITGRVWKGSVFGGVKGKSELPGIVVDYLNNKLDVDSFHTHTRSLSEMNEAFEHLHGGECVRCVVDMS